MRLITMVMVVGCLLGASAGRAEDLVLKGATVHTVSGETLAVGDVLVKDGKIASVGGSVDAPGATVIDLKGMHLYPGLIAATSSLGLTEIGAVRATEDTSEVGGWTPDVDAWIAVNPDSELIPVARANGITHALTLPFGGTVSGRSGVLQLDGWTWEDMTIRRPAALHLFWPGMDLNLAAKGDLPPGAEIKTPEKQAEERRARLKEIDDFFEEARAYAKARAAGGKTVPAWEAMLPALKGEIPIFIHADDERQIRAAVDWAAKEGFTRVVIAGARDADRCADVLAKAKIPVIYEHVFDQPSRDTEPYDVHFSAAKKLFDAGVTFAFSQGAGSGGSWSARNLPYSAAQAAAFGLPRDEAVKAITLTPAKLLGLADRLGSIETGKEASLIAVDGDILDIRSNVRRMWIAGHETSLESRHTRLRDKYGNRPKPK
ncbi:MAG: amidohydrolase family protein [Planctomycetes bacterium]|nr:amidohydrolase family protein [Planctomycetota bacterium]